LVERLTDLSVISTFANSFIELQKKSFQKIFPAYARGWPVDEIFGQKLQLCCNPALTLCVSVRMSPPNAPFCSAGAGGGC
jgi:hypothetical protein